MSVNVSNAYKFFGGAEGGGGGLQPEDFHELVMTGGYSGGTVTRRYNVFEGLNMVVGNLFFTKHNQLFEAYNPLNEDNVSVDITEDSVMFSTSNTWTEVFDSANTQIPMFLRTGGEGPSDPEKIFTYVGLFTFDDGGVDKSGAMFYRLNTDLKNFEVWIIDEDDGWTYQTIDFGSANIIDTTAAGLNWSNPDPDVCAEIFTRIGSLLARGIIPVLQVDGQPTKKYAYFVTDGGGYHFIGQWGAFGADYVKYYISPSTASIDNTTLHQYLHFDTLTTQDFDFSVLNVTSCTKLLKNNTMYILTDWDGTWAPKDIIQFHCEKADPKNICIKLKQCNINENGAWNIAVDTSDSVQLTNANDQEGATDHIVKGNSYNIFVSDYEWLAEEFVDIDPSTIVTDQELRDALDTLKSRTVFVLDVGSISGLQAAHPNGNGFVGTLFSPVMDFDLSTNTKVVFDVEQTSNNASDMENFVLAIYEYDKGDSQQGIAPSFKWVCNTNDIASELYNNGNPQTGIHKANLYAIRSTDKKLYGGKLYYALFAGKWNGWGFAGNSSPNSMHSDIMIAPTCDNRNSAIGGNIGTVYPSIALAPTGSQDDFYTETQGTSRLFMALTNVQLS